MVPAERQFELPTLRLAALEWGEPGGEPCLALHGWLDNAGSFEHLAPLLPGLHLVAPDAAGHGSSGHRSADAGYHIWTELYDILDVAAALGWERFSLLGHSRGAAVATLFAGTFPERVERLMLIEGGLPIIGAAEEAPANLARVLTRTRELAGRAGRVYATREAAIAERAEGFSPVSIAAAEILARRSLRAVAGGWQWQADQRLKAGSEFRLTRDELAAFLGRVTAPSICVLAEESPFGDWDIYRDLLGLIRGIEVHRIPGRHHFHLEGQAAEIAARLNRFIGRA